MAIRPIIVIDFSYINEMVSSWANRRLPLQSRYYKSNFCVWNFEHLDLFRIWCLVLRILVTFYYSRFTFFYPEPKELPVKGKKPPVK